MRRIHYLSPALLLAFLGCLVVSCGSETEVTSADGMDTGVTSSKIVYTISKSSTGSIVTGDGTQTSEECALKSLNVYLFQLSGDADESSATDADYVFYGSYPFTSGSSETESTFVDDGTGGSECYIGITEDMVGLTLRSLVVANDTPTTTLTTGTTTLEDFLSSLATASVTDGCHADVLVGNPSSDSATGYPMTGEAVTSDDVSYVTLSVSNVELDVTLVRNVARIDLVNDYPGLTITDVTLTNTPNQSYLFAQSEVSEPSGSEYVTIYPLEEYCDESDLTYTSWAYSDDDDADNTQDRVLYLYEQSSSETSCPTVTVSFSTSDGSGTVSVPFQDSDGNYVSVERNHLYTIQFGEGSESQEIEVSLFEASDWSQEDANTIDVVLTTTTDDDGDEE